MNSEIIWIYEKLSSFFDKKTWWASDSVDETLIGCILGQSVAWSNAKKAINLLKEHNLCSLKAIAACDAELLKGLIKSSLYASSKTRYLKELSAFFEKYEYNYQKFIDSHLDVKIMRKDLLKVKGVGNETADSILLYALHLPSFVVDAYTKRIFYRYGIISDIKIKYEKLQKLFEENLNKDVNLYNNFHGLLVRLGNGYCKKKNPLCGDCPIELKCQRRID